MPDPQTYNEKELLNKVASGDQACFAELVVHYKNNIYTTALHLTHDSAIAEEIVQDVFLVVWIKRQSLPTIENFPGYLYGITKKTVYNALRNIIKQNRQKREGIQATEKPFHTDPEDKLLEKDYNAILQKAIARLPERQKQVYLLVKQNGLKREEVARLLQISPETVKSNLDEALRKIRAYCLVYIKDMAVFLIIWLKIK